MSDGKVDVVMCTWNSCSPWFKRCLLSIRENIPIHCFILVDRNSNDKTVDTVNEIFPDAIIIQTSEKLARQRSIGISKVDTEWFLFCDDDIEFNGEWYKAITKKIRDDVGGLNGVAIPTDFALEKFFKLRLETSFLSPRKTKVTKNQSDRIRGLTGNTLIRTSIVKDWNPPVFLSAYEDHHLLIHILQKGYVWVTVSDAKTRHNGNFSSKSEITKAKWNTAAGRLIGAIKLVGIFRKAILGVGIGFLASLRIGNPRILILSVSMHLGNIIGYLKWNKYLGPYPRLNKPAS